MNELRQKIGNEIKSIRKKLGMTQKEFTDLYNSTNPKDLRITQVDVSRYENGESTIPGDKLEKIRSLNI